MNKRDTIRAYKSELREIETQEVLFKKTINTITRRKNVLLNALDALGTSSAPSGRNKVLSQKEMLELRASIYKKSPAITRLKK